MSLHANIALYLSYDGSDFFGWQSNGEGPSIESHLEEVLHTILGWRPSLQAASRTDRGVHAYAQVVNFFHPHPTPCLNGLQKDLNRLLPETIRIHQILLAPFNFHPSIDTCAKEYHYFVDRHPRLSPFTKNYAWHCPFPLDIPRMQSTARELLGHHDFKAFSNAQPKEREETHRELYKLEIVDENFLRFEIKANRFLYKMARNLVGTLIHIGCGKIEMPIKKILESRDRQKAGITAPAHGLFLHSIDYEQNSLHSRPFEVKFPYDFTK